MKYDDAAWHYSGDFPAELPKQAGAIHIGMFLAWLLLHDMVGQEHQSGSVRSIANLKNRLITGIDFLLLKCDEKLTDADLNQEGDLFAQYYYNGESGKRQYLDDYDEALCNELESMYYVEDSWENYDCLEPYINKAYQQWVSLR